jgi:diadenosine tetraphosphate (Ap4A) HIT family hydrolase
MLATRDHVEGPWSLSADDAATLGPALRDVARAAKAATAAERIHVVFLGENALHVHFGFFPRASGEPALLDNGPMIEAMRTADANRAASIRDAVGSLLRGT